MARFEIGGAEMAPMGQNAVNADSFFELGLTFATGRDVSTDLVAAHKWFNLAAMKGVNEARKWRAQISSEMSAEEIAEAQRQARKWLAA